MSFPSSYLPARTNTAYALSMSFDVSSSARDASPVRRRRLRPGLRLTENSLQMILSDTEKLAALGMIPLLEGITSATGGNHHSSNNHHGHSPNSVAVSSRNGDSPVGSGGGGCGGGGGWRYRCKYCTYTTESKTVFNAHQRTHTGDRPYRCRFCAYAAKQKSHVTLHERLHTGEKPYSCPYCSYRCSDPTALRSHKFSKHREMFLSEAASKAARAAK